MLFFRRGVVVMMAEWLGRLTARFNHNTSA
jgi:hypothetical protein